MTPKWLGKEDNSTSEDNMTEAEKKQLAKDIEDFKKKLKQTWEEE
jgi:hypothetical protein